QVKGEERMESVESPLQEKPNPSNSSSSKPKGYSNEKLSTVASLTNVAAEACAICDLKNHKTAECRKALRMLLTEKREKLKEKGACFSCLRVNVRHRAKDCRTKATCNLCNGGHYASMCPRMDEKVNEERGAKGKQHSEPALMNKAGPQKK